MDKNKLKIGMKVKVKGKYDRTPYIAEIIEHGKIMFIYRSNFIISCANYKDVLEIVEQ